MLNNDGFKLYDENFYNKNSKTEFAAETIIKFVFGMFKHQRVIDIGCGRGAWLVACKNAGAEFLYGMDGPWNSQADMLDQSIQFTETDLGGDVFLPSNEKFDLCISLEVAEHLEKRCARNFILSLCNASDLVLFSAAFEGQGGTGHINENTHSYWAKIFQEYGFLPFDIIRPKFWGYAGIDFWYKQNMFLYIKKNSDAFLNTKKIGIFPVESLFFMDAVHPELYNIKRNNTISARELVKLIPSVFANSIKKRF
jgi:hypothetical protein